MQQYLPLKKNRIFLLVFVIIIGLVLSACSSNQGNRENSEPNLSAGQSTGQEAINKSLTIIRNFKADTLDPHHSWEPLRAGIVETLTRLDENLEIKPWLAVKWESIDPVTWIFTIRDGISFQDGTVLDAAAAKASFERGIAASKALAGALKIESMKAVGQKLTIVTTEPHAALPSELVNPYAAVISVEAEKKVGTEAFNLAPTGTGPFKVKQFTPNVEILLERNDAYWNGKAKLNEIIYKFNEDGNVRALALQAKEADIVYQLPAETISSIEQDNELKVESISGLRVHSLLYNYQKPQLQDHKVRKAVDMLLNRESIAADIMLGQAVPANGPFNTSLPFGSKNNIPPFNVDEARKLLGEAGYHAGADGKLTKEGKPLTLELITYKGRPELPLIAQLLQSDAVKAGLTFKITTVENVDTYLHENKEWDLATYSMLSAPRGDGGYFLNSALVPGGSLNVADIKIDGLNHILEQLNTESDIKQRAKLTMEAAAIADQEIPQSYIVYPKLIVGVNKRVIDWKPGAEEYYMVTNKMDVK